VSSEAVHGFADDQFGALRDVFAANIASGADLGASVCVTLEGETVVDLWAGYMDEARTRPWHRDTLVNVYSCTKTMTALVALLLADRGELDLDAPVARYWPEFAQRGKSAVLVRHVLGHSAGLAEWETSLEVAEVYDWQTCVTRLAGQAPAWPPGTASGYHSLTQGYLIGEIVRRITDRTIGVFFREEIAAPLGADFHIGLPASEDVRVAILVGDGSAPVMTADPSGPSSVALDIDLPSTRAWRAAEIPAAGGIGNARSMAEIHRILANDGMANGRRFLSTAGCRRAQESHVAGVDRVLGVNIRFGLGMALGGDMMPGDATLYWGGHGGSLVIIDPDARTSFAFAMNRMAGTTTGDERALSLAMAMWESLGQL
jgi:CubicO group peptidase (beta-lactamase class C family)